MSKKKPTSPIRTSLETLALIFLAGLLATLAFLAQGCGDSWEPGLYCAGSTSPITQKIVGGQESSDRRATVALIWGTDYLGCSGVAISPYTVLTAAHCRTAGGVALEDGGHVYPVEEAIVHPAYDEGAEVWPGPRFDLAMLILTEPLPEPYASTIYDPPAGGFEPDLRTACTELVAQGFGWNEEIGIGVLHEAQYEIGNLDTWNLYGFGVNQEAVCNGDSGGPLYAYVEGHPYAPERTLMLAGIHVSSFGSFDVCYGPTVHINLINFKPWIEENVR